MWTPLALDAQGKKFRKAAKILSIHSSPVYSLTRVDRFLVSGAADGYVRFFDDRLRLVAWFEVAHFPSLQGFDTPSHICLCDASGPMFILPGTCIVCSIAC